MIKIFFIIFLIVGSSAHAAEILNVAGSTTVEKGLLEPTASAMEQAIGIKVQVRGLNSGKGFDELRDGKIIASVSSAPLSKLLEKAGLAGDTSYQEHVIATDVIVPIVHLENPVSELTHAQLSDLNTGKIGNWQAVGGKDQPVVVVTSQKTAATRLMFQEQVMQKAEYAPGVREVRSTREEIKLVSKFRGGIGAVSESFIKKNPGKVKVVKSKAITRPLSFITKGVPEPMVQKVIDFLRSDAAKAIYQ
ncbi:MAG: solute-binding protein [Magnetococcales bacterium]|nr:substrate-binding domain-containing protein [Magnetococcales bacterium]NGZ06742.1 solute-binding protein [Magnetococcales bacterium]